MKHYMIKLCYKLTYDDISVTDISLGGQTDAGGIAVSRTSKLVSKIIISPILYGT